jgi:hypothetical protein
MSFLSDPAARRPRDIEQNDEAIRDLRQRLYATTGRPATSPADKLIIELHRRVANTTGVRRQRLQEHLQKAQEISINLFRNYLRLRKPSDTLMAKRAKARAFMNHFAS